MSSKDGKGSVRSDEVAAKVDRSRRLLPEAQQRMPPGQLRDVTSTVQQLLTNKNQPDAAPQVNHIMDPLADDLHGSDNLIYVEEFDAL